jgi:adenylate kinase family enzyme
MESKRRVILLLGPPGSGKDTQCAMIDADSARHRYQSIPIGERLRALSRTKEGNDIKLDDVFVNVGNYCHKLDCSELVEDLWIA